MAPLLGVYRAANAIEVGLAQLEARHLVRVRVRVRVRLRVRVRVRVSVSHQGEVEAGRGRGRHRSGAQRLARRVAGVGARVASIVGANKGNVFCGEFFFLEYEFF